MSKSTLPKQYFEDIDKKLIEHIKSATSSIKIAMAWFTDNNIKQALIDRKWHDSQIDIEILVDKNEINNKYFFDYSSEFLEANIKLFENNGNKFLHDKFMVIDNLITIVGSYNYTKRAKRNRESITVIPDTTFSSVRIRRFEFLKDDRYIDQNIHLLYKHLEFAQTLLSTYYPFNYKEFRKYYKKIVLGDCFSHFNGYGDEVTYYPGFVFNEKAKLDKKLKNSEFGMPVTKNAIKDFRKNDFEKRSYIDYVESDGDFDEYIENLQESLNNLDIYFHHKVETTYTSEKLEELIVSGVNIIIEKEIWSNNFKLFINDIIIESLFSSFPEVQKDYREDYY